MDVFFQVLGWVGAFGLLLGFYLNSSNRLSSDSRTYQLMNLIPAVMLAANAYYIGSIPFLIVNVFWAGVAILSLLQKSKPQTTNA